MTRLLVSEFAAVDRPSGAIFMKDSDGFCHLVPFSHTDRRALAGDWSHPAFRPPLCSDVAPETLGLDLDGPVGPVCRRCSRILADGHWPNTKMWPVPDDIIEDGRAIMKLVWGGAEADSAIVSAFLDAVLDNHMDPGAAAARCGARSLTSLGRSAALCGRVDEVLAVVRHKGSANRIRNGAEQAAPAEGD